MNATDNDKIQTLAQEVITHTRNTLIVRLRFMDAALGQLVPTPSLDVPLATDGDLLFYDPIHVLKLYRRSQEETARDYLHVVMHCVFRHFFVSPMLRRDLWDLACDIAAEAAIDDLELAITDAPRRAKQQAVKSSLLHATGALTAEKLYRHYLDVDPSPEELRALCALFCADDHSLWYQPDPFSSGAASPSKKSKGNDPSDPETSEQGQETCEGEDRENQGDAERENEEEEENGVPRSAEGSDGDGRPEKPSSEESAEAKDKRPADDNASAAKNSAAKEDLAQKWKEVAERIKQDLETFSRRHGDTAGNLMQSLREVTREKYDYTAFLKKFAALHEAMTINDEEFDYVYYTYGIRLYGKMPLVEPLEYKDVKRIRDFVIVIDTSGSVRGDLVQSFLQKTYNVLKNEESFFVKFNLHLVQCDAAVQSDRKITSQEEFDNYIKTMELRGFGGTDFRPAFAYVNELIEKKEFTNLKGLIYFTDGYGDYPKEKPPYEAAFVFVKEDDRVPEVPSWAIKLILRPEEI